MNTNSRPVEVKETKVKDAKVVKKRGKLVSINQYFLLERIGKGAFAEVRLAEVRSESHNPMRYAIKILDKQLLLRKRFSGFRKMHDSPNKDEERAIAEIAIMKKLSHPNLVKLYEVIDDEEAEQMLLVMEYVQGGPIMDFDPDTRLFSYYLTGGPMGEATACRYFRDLISVCEYLHLHHIAHRDLKPDNLLLHLDGTIKVTDFGVSAFFAAETMRQPVGLKDLLRSRSRGMVMNAEGTWAFYSPEMCAEDRSAYSAYQADVWAAAVCFWIFLFARLPFEAEEPYQIFQVIRETEPTYPRPVSPELERLFKRLLNKDPTMRLSVDEILEHQLIRLPIRRTSIKVDLLMSDMTSAVSSAVSVKRTPSNMNFVSNSTGHSNGGTSPIPAQLKQTLIARAKRASNSVSQRKSGLRMATEKRIMDMVKRAERSELGPLDSVDYSDSEDSFDWDDDCCFDSRQPSFRSGVSFRSSSLPNIGPFDSMGNSMKMESNTAPVSPNSDDSPRRRRSMRSPRGAFTRAISKTYRVLPSEPVVTFSTANSFGFSTADAMQIAIDSANKATSAITANHSLRFHLSTDYDDSHTNSTSVDVYDDPNVIINRSSSGRGSVSTISSVSSRASIFGVSNVIPFQCTDPTDDANMADDDDDDNTIPRPGYSTSYGSPSKNVRLDPLADYRLYSISSGERSPSVSNSRSNEASSMFSRDGLSQPPHRKLTLTPQTLSLHSAVLLSLCASDSMSEDAASRRNSLVASAPSPTKSPLRPITLDPLVAPPQVATSVADSEGVK